MDQNSKDAETAERVLRAILQLRPEAAHQDGIHHGVPKVGDIEAVRAWARLPAGWEQVAEYIWRKVLGSPTLPTQQDVRTAVAAMWELCS